MMHPSLFFLIIVCFIYHVRAIPAATFKVTKTESKRWDEFKQKYNKKYHLRVEPLRFGAFIDNYRKIIEFNKEGHSFTVGINQFADMTNHEFKMRLNKRKIRTSSLRDDIMKNLISLNESELPIYGDDASIVDWREKGVVTSVKDQANCGSCYSFSAVGVAESQYALKNNIPVSFSAQLFVDCSYRQGNEGCNGGLPEFVFEHARRHGYMSEDDYPYTGKNDKCSFNAKKVLTKTVGYFFIRQGDEQDLTNKIARHGPVSVGVDASRWSFQFYSSGIYYDPKCENCLECLDHAMIVVGYGSEDKNNTSDYYIVKNSWGDSWGEDGYVRMPRNSDNHCGIATSAVITTVL